MKTVTRLFLFLFAALLLASVSACCGNGEPTEEPAPSGPQATEPVETEPAAPLPAAMTGDELQDVIVNFFGAMAESDFSRAQTYCTDEFYDETFGEIEDFFSMLSEEEQTEMMTDFKIDEEQQGDLNSAVSEYSGDSATLTITEEDGLVTVFEFVKVDGDWKISGGME